MRMYDQQGPSQQMGFGGLIGHVGGISGTRGQMGQMGNQRSDVGIQQQACAFFERHNVF